MVVDKEKPLSNVFLSSEKYYISLGLGLLVIAGLRALP